jgi:hypothetical protein
MDRRTFLKATAAAAVAHSVPARQSNADSRIEVILDEPVATIAPEN